jgi:hypothetical protein
LPFVCSCRRGSLGREPRLSIFRTFVALEATHEAYVDAYAQMPPKR